MLDVRLITLLPPNNAIAQAPSAQTVTTQGATIQAQINPGSILSGFVINRDAQGNPILRTEKGDIPFISNLFLKIGSEVVIRMQNTGGHQNAHIVTVNGLPPEVAAEQSGFGDEQEIVVNRQQPSTQQQVTTNTNAQKSTPIAPPTPNPLSPGQTISAIVVTPAPAASAAGNLSPGTSLLLSVVTDETPQQTLSALAQLTPETTIKTTTSALESLLPATPATSAKSPLAEILTPTTATTYTSTTTSAAIGQSVPFAHSNQQAANAKLTGALGHTIIATAVQQNDDGSVTFESPIGVLRAANLGTLQPGQQVTLRVSSVASPNSYTIALANEAAPLPPTALTQLSRTWPSLAHIMQLLGEAPTNAIIPNFTNAPNLPQAGSQILFFLSALKGGSFRDWLGTQHVKSLEEKGYGALIKKAEGEFMQLARQFNEPLPNNWQSAYFPVMANGEVQQVRAFIKREKKKNEQGKTTGDEDTRFVLEMELSQLGEMQMDGLVKRREQSLQFDLIIRSLEPLPKDLQQDIHTVYNSTAELTGYRGQLAFHTVHAFPIHPLEDTTPHVFDDVVV